MKILIADDQFNNRVLLERILSDYGKCDFATTGLEAVELFEFALENGSPYDLVCLDIMMPGIDGQIALRRIRTIEEENGLQGDNATVIFMISALDSETEVIKAFFRGGCTDYLAKPISRSKLLEKLKEYKLIA